MEITVHATLTAEDASEQHAARHGNDREQDNGVWDDGLPSAGREMPCSARRHRPKVTALKRDCLVLFWPQSHSYSSSNLWVPGSPQYFLEKFLSSETQDSEPEHRAYQSPDVKLNPDHHLLCKLPFRMESLFRDEVVLE